MNRTPLVALAATCSLLVAALWAPGPASASPKIGLEVDLAIPVGDTSDGFDLGWGLQGRAGFGLPLPGFELVAEAIFDFTSFPASDVDASAEVIRVGIGARAGLPIPFVPTLFAHLGYGSVSFESMGIDLSDDGLTWDIGLASDLLGLPLLDLGVHVAYKTVIHSDSDSNFSWVGLGVHAVFGL